MCPHQCHSFSLEKRQAAPRGAGGPASSHPTYRAGWVVSMRTTRELGPSPGWLVSTTQDLGSSPGWQWVASTTRELPCPQLGPCSCSWRTCARTSHAPATRSRGASGHGRARAENFTLASGHVGRASSGPSGSSGLLRGCGRSGLRAAGGWLKTHSCPGVQVGGFCQHHSGLASKSRVGVQDHPWVVMRLAIGCLFKNGGAATKSRVVSTTNSNSIRSIKTAH